MRINDTVTCIDARGQSHESRVTAVTGSGNSGWKTLSLRYLEGTGDHQKAVDVDGVPHKKDAKQGAAHWSYLVEVESVAERDAKAAAKAADARRDAVKAEIEANKRPAPRHTRAEPVAAE